MQLQSPSDRITHAGRIWISRLGKSFSPQPPITKCQLKLEDSETRALARLVQHVVLWRLLGWTSSPGTSGRSVTGPAWLSSSAVAMVSRSASWVQTIA